VEGVKVIGNWLSAADCMEVQGVNSVLKNNFCHVSDDSIKLSVRGIKVYSTTIIQGNAGSAVSLGAYGYNRGTSDAEAHGVFVHRIAHSTTGYDDHGGVVASRTCPVEAASGEMSGLLDISVHDLYVADIRNFKSPNVAPGPNTIVRLFAVGLAAVGDFCGCGDQCAQAYPISGLRFWDWTVMTDPYGLSLIHDDYGGQWNEDPNKKALTIGWVEDYGNNPWVAQTISIFHQEGDGDQGYYPCASLSDAGCLSFCGGDWSSAECYNSGF